MVQLISYKRYLECTLIQWRLSIYPQVHYVCLLIVQWSLKFFLHFFHVAVQISLLLTKIVICSVRFKCTVFGEFIVYCDIVQCLVYSTYILYRTVFCQVYCKLFSVLYIIHCNVYVCVVYCCVLYKIVHCNVQFMIPYRNPVHGNNTLSNIQYTNQYKVQSR